MPEVSVVVPTYNRAATILRAVGSALAQTHCDLEVVVVDDGGGDDTPALLAGLGDPRLRLERHARNRGAAAARNTGIAAARGAFIAFLDSDDAWLPRKLEVQLAALRRAAPEEAVSCHGVRMHLLDHGIEREQPLEPAGDWFLRLARDCDLSPGTTLLARREAFDRIGPLDESLPRFEDWDWLLRYAAAGGRVLALRETLAHVWNRRGRLGEQHELSARRFLAKHAALHARLPSGLRRAAECDIWLQVSGTYAFQGRRLDAARIALRAARRRPLHCLLRVGRHATARLAAAMGRPLPQLTGRAEAAAPARRQGG
ncbi:glycosyltransferase family 2 protein [Crenalkalicoccus roseus]|uniref:glycosyltransferase family 2 protein n=1 Tax=Crenalkalicoccus roseus TaxID=1485588 RepID=UPI0010809BEE|nr:glycosyltransferase family A protein [Crenalkalicoccus roseus]